MSSLADGHMMPFDKKITRAMLVTTPKEAAHAAVFGGDGDRSWGRNAVARAIAGEREIPDVQSVHGGEEKALQTKISSPPRAAQMRLGIASIQRPDEDRLNPGRAVFAARPHRTA